MALPAAAARSPQLGRGAVAALGHALALVGFAQPWVVGEFGAREQFSGLDLTRVASDLVAQGPAGATLALPISAAVLLLVPLAAANALVLLAAHRGGVLSRTAAHRAAALLALPIAAVAALGLVLVVLSMGEGSLIDRPGVGLPLVVTGAVLALVSLSRPVSRRTRLEG